MNQYRRKDNTDKQIQQIINYDSKIFFDNKIIDLAIIDAIKIVKNIINNYKIYRSKYLYFIRNYSS